MRKFALLLLCFVVVKSSAEKILFTNSPEEIDITDDVIIDANTGDITVTSIDDLLVLVNPPGFVSLYSDVDYRYNVGDPVSIKYAKGFVNGCQLSDNPANQNSWINLNSTNGISEYGVTLNELPKTYTIKCNASYGAGAVLQDEITFIQEQVAQTGNAPTLTLSANPTSIVGSGSTTLSWTVGNDATSCTASNGWTGNKTFSNGTHTQTVSLSSTKTYQMTCANQYGNVSRQVTVSVSTQPGNPACSGITMPPLATQTPKTMTYAEANDGQTFGASTNTNARITYDISQLLILSNFSTSQQNFYRRLQFYPTPSSANAVYADTVSISECPGDFNQQSAVCVVIADPGSQSQFFISTDPNAPSNYCVIEPNKTYYLNFIHDIAPFDNTPGRCLFTSDQSCQIFFNEISDNG